MASTILQVLQEKFQTEIASWTRMEQIQAMDAIQSGMIELSTDSEKANYLWAWLGYPGNPPAEPTPAKRKLVKFGSMTRTVEF